MKKIKILIAKPGLDGHDRGAKFVSQVLRNAGYEVIYTGIRQTPEQIVTSAIQEDVDFLGMSILSGAHNVLFKKVMDILRNENTDDIIVFAGGVIPEDDIPYLKSLGIKEIFTPGTSSKKIIEFIENNASKE